MKWSDLTLKERKQIYDAVRAENPNASYFDIKSQFDLIPEYEDGKDGESNYKTHTPEENSWVARRTVELGLEGKPVSQDSLYTIVDRARVQNKPGTHDPKWYEPRPGTKEQAQQVLSGLNKTVGTAATAASLLTMGGWNLLRFLNAGKGTPYRLWAAKNASAGAKAGAAADIGNFIEEPTVTNGVQVVLSKVGSKDLTTTSNKIVNTISAGFDFDDLTKVPTYEDGGKKVTPPKELGLTPGTPEYYKRQQQISGKANSIQPEVYVTSAGYIKDAIDFGEDVYQGNYGQAMIDVALNALPWGSSKIAKRSKRYLSRIGNSEVTVLNSKSSKSKVKTEADYDSEFSEVIRRERNIKKYNDEISRSIETAVYPDEETLKWLQFTDNMYGTNYQKAYKELAARDMTNRSKYIKYSELPDGIQGKTIGKNIDPNIGPTIGNYQIQLDPQQYVPGTGSHELSHVVDQLAGDVIKNRYLNFLADSDNIMSVPELEKKGIRIPPKIQFYLSDPQEAKAHMIQLKHAMLNSGKINNWSQKVTQQELEDFLFDPLNTQLTGSMNKLQYKMYRNKSRFLDRFNRVNPLAIGAPIGLAATNNKDKQSN